MTDAPTKARCRWCERERLLRKDGLIREHSLWAVLPSGRLRMFKCPGSGSPPMSALAMAAQPIIDGARALMPALSVYYHTGQLPRDADGKIIR